MGWITTFLHGDNGNLLYEHMECEQLALTKLFRTHSVLFFIQSLAFPMLSTSIFSSNGSIYEQSAVFDSEFQLNQTALDVIGLPALTGSNAWANLVQNLAVSLSVRIPVRINHYWSDWRDDRTCCLVLGSIRSWLFQSCISKRTNRSSFQSKYGFYSENNFLESPTWLQAMQKYKENPWWWYVILLFLSFIAGKSFF